MSPYLAEFVGTTTLLYLGNGVNANVSLKKLMVMKVDGSSSH